MLEPTTFFLNKGKTIQRLTIHKTDHKLSQIYPKSPILEDFPLRKASAEFFVQRHDTTKIKKYDKSTEFLQVSEK